jgi:thymidylate synthase
MLWILSGSTSLEQLQKYGVHYWDSWADAEHCGWYDLPVGEFGRTYGAQWRSFNAGGPEPIDQVKRVFDILAKNPEDRGMVITPWNPYDVDHLVVKPCHGHVQFVHVEGKLNMLVTQRSADVPVGIPSNLVMYKFFQMLVCMKTGLKEGDYVHNMGDTHYYEDQWPGVELMIEREAKPFPKVTIDPIMVRILDMMLEGEVDPLGTKEINPEGKPYTELIEQWVKLEGYDPHPAVPRDMMPVAI